MSGSSGTGVTKGGRCFGFDVCGGLRCEDVDLYGPRLDLVGPQPTFFRHTIINQSLQKSIPPREEGVSLFGLGRPVMT